MKDNAKITIVEDTVTEYLQRLATLSADETNTKNFLRDASSELHFRYIAPRMPKWNPNLIHSPIEPEHQLFEGAVEKSVIELLYTGFTEDANDNLLPKGVWSEFGDKSQGILERDYAYFQETGKDPIADADDAKHKFFVKTGTSDYNTEYHYKVDAYLDRLMHVERWQRTSRFIHLYDFEE